MNEHATHQLSLTDIDAVLPEEFEVLHPSDPHAHSPDALRVVRHATTGQIYTFQTLQQYLHFVLSVSTRRVLAEVSRTRYIELSSQYDYDVYFHSSVNHTVAALTRNMVVLHRLKSDETSVRFELSRAEMVTLISSYQSYLDDGEQEESEAEATRDPFLDFPDDFA